MCGDDKRGPKMMGRQQQAQMPTQLQQQTQQIQNNFNDTPTCTNHPNKPA